ncbi:MAG: hypothetical protein WA982_06545 [Rubrobacteraceae bacterium]
MSPEEVLELMRTARRRYETVRAALHYRGYGPTIKALRERYQQSEAVEQELDGIRGFQQISESLETFGHDEPDGVFEWRIKAWEAKWRRFYSEGTPYRIELDLSRSIHPGDVVDVHAWDGRTTNPDGTLGILDHRTGGSRPEKEPFWLSLARDTYWATYLLNPDGPGIPSFASSLELRVTGTTVKTGREAVRLVGVVGPEWNWETDDDQDSEPLGWGADEYEFLVDTERGVLLRCASRLNGADFHTLEVEDIYFDEQFTEDVFTSHEPLAW